MDIEKLRAEVCKKYYTSNDAYIDIAYHAKVHPSTVGKFIRGITRCPTFITRWGLEKYLKK